MGLMTQPKADTLAKLAEVIDAGKLKVFVNRTYPLADMQAAMNFRVETAAPGKIVMTMTLMMHGTVPAQHTITKPWDADTCTHLRWTQLRCAHGLKGFYLCLCV